MVIVQHWGSDRQILRSFHSHLVLSTALLCHQ